MNRIVFAAAFAIGLAAVAWVGMGFIGSSWMALSMTAVIAGVYLMGAFELVRFRAATSALAAALADIPQPVSEIGAWLDRVPACLRNPVRLRIEGERAALPGPALTPYLVGLLVMLGMLGTFLGMVVTFKGAVFALEGSTDLQAIRSALAAPIKGLGLSFGTSVAGVAASGMLGLISAISRRERIDVGRHLDSCIATVFRPLSLTHQRQEAFKALQIQAQALPDIVDKLHAMMDGMERRSQQLNEHLVGQQQQFHRDVAVAYTGLAEAVGKSLTDSLTASARVAGESIKPVVEAAMSAIAEESLRTHQRLIDATQTQLTGLSSQFESTAATVSETWTTALQTHARTSDHLTDRLDGALGAFTDVFEQRSSALLTRFNEALAQAQSDQASADEQRLGVWTRTLESSAATLLAEWQRAGARTADHQQGVCRELENAAGQITAHTSRTLHEMAGLLTQSEALILSRVDAEAQWVSLHGDRMDQLASLWRSELGALRHDEALRGQAAIERLGELQAALASHLATLGAALEVPMTRLMQTASDVPQAAAEVIAQLRREMTQLAERDNQALEERAAVMAQIKALLQTIGRATGEQQAMMESLVASSKSMLEKAGDQLSESLGAQAGKVVEVAAHVNASAVELSSLGESFSQGVQLFSSSNEKLMESLQRIESSINQSASRSDEQLAYYVAQAREVIDLSITSQQGIVEDLRRLHARQASLADGGV